MSFWARVLTHLPLLHADLRVFRLFKPHVRPMIFATALALLSGALGTMPILIIREFGETLVVGGDAGSLARLAVGIVLLSVAAATSQYGQQFVLRNVGYRVVQRLRSELVRRYQYLSLGFLQSQKTGDLTSRVVSDTAVVQLSVMGVVDAFNEPFKLIAITGWAVFLSPRLALLFVLVLPAVAFLVRRINSAIRRYAKRTQAGLGSSAGMVAESLSGAREIRAFGLEEQQLLRFEREHDVALRMMIKGARATSAGPAIVLVIGSLSAGLVIYFGGMMVVRGQSTFPDLLAFLAAVGMAYEPIRRLTRVNAQLGLVSGAADRVWAILDEPMSVPDTGTKIAPEEVESVTFDRVGFSYLVADAVPEPPAQATPLRPSRRVLHDVSFEVRKGEVVALVGESGSGKTTLVSLVPRFYDVDGGAVRMNGTDVREFTLESLRRRTALVSQETFLFSDTVRENIRLGRLDASDEEIVEAAKAAYAHGFIERLPDGYDTVLGERGTGLSGGQRQRLAIARAILRRAPVLLLDEATSSLDSESEEEVQKALEMLMRDRATLVVAHRLSTIKNADRIVVLSGGRVLEVGSHRDLYDRAGEYRRLHDIQFRTAS